MRLLLAFLMLVVLAVSPATAKNTTTLCGEKGTKRTGYLNDIYYALFDSTSTAVPSKIPLVLWLAGGPGCSGLMATLFEIGPCMFDEEANKISPNPFAWTTQAHVIFVDQPRGTGFSKPFEPPGWTEELAMQQLAGFVDAFFKKYPILRANDFFIFGESWGGHYAPDLGALLVKQDASWRTRLKGVGIGNGLVSPIANLQTYLDFAKQNKYANDLLGDLEPVLQQKIAQALDLSIQCQQALAPKTGSVRALAFEADDDAPPAVCLQAAGAVYDTQNTALYGIVSAGHNPYDLRRPCRDDPTQYCYYFSRLEDYVNKNALGYFGVPADSKWTMCSLDVAGSLAPVDNILESGRNVATLLDNGVRVLVFVGDADATCSWNNQDRWTRDLQWKGKAAFNQAAVKKLVFGGKQAGTVRTARGLSLARIYDAGHMLPHDQPQVALELLRAFVGACRADGSVFS